MTFADLLRSYIGERTLNEMASLCAEKGVKLDPTYISKLRTGNRPAPDDEQTVRILAEVCEKDPEPLVLLAQLERNPQVAIKTLVSRAVTAAFQPHELLHELLIQRNKIAEMTKSGANVQDIAAYLTGNEEYTTQAANVVYNYFKQFSGIMTTVLPEIGHLIVMKGFEGADEDDPFLRDVVSNRAGHEKTLIKELAATIGVPAALLTPLIATAKALAGRKARTPVPARNEFERILLEHFHGIRGLEDIGVTDDVWAYAKDATDIGSVGVVFSDPKIGLALNKNLYHKGWRTVTDLAAMVQWRDPARNNQPEGAPGGSDSPDQQ